MSGSIRIRDFLIIVSCTALIGCSEDKEKEGENHDSGVEDSEEVMDSGSTENNSITKNDASGGQVQTVDAEDTGAATDSGTTVCSILLGVECDGDEDCPNGEVCCGTYRSTEVTAGYTSINCQSTCEFEFDFDYDSDAGVDTSIQEMPDMKFKLCHKGEDCSTGGSDAEAEESCWSSSVLPSFLAVCLSSSTTFGEPVSDDTKNAVAGEINCGDQTCTVGTEKCCLTGYTGGSYCAETDQECDCDHAP